MSPASPVHNVRAYHTRTSRAYRGAPEAPQHTSACRTCHDRSPRRRAPECAPYTFSRRAHGERCELAAWISPRVRRPGVSCRLDQMQPLEFFSWHRRLHFVYYQL